jgi:GAF domain-containing protein
LVQHGHLRQAGAVFVLALTGAASWAGSPVGISEIGIGLFALPIVCACVLLGIVEGAVVTLVTSAIAGVLSYFYIQTDPQTTNSAGAVIIPIVFVLMLGGVTISLVLALQHWGHGMQRKARQLEAAILINQAANTATNVTSLLNMTVERVRDIFGFYHVQVFLLDQQRSRDNPRLSVARLEASTGRAGAALLARGHALPVGSRSIVGQATYYGQPVVVNDVQTSTVFHPNELLPDTRAEVAIPLVIGESVLGALDVQSTVPNEFLPEEVSALQVIANQLAGFVEKTRLVTELQRRSAEHEALLEDAQANLRQIEELSRRLTREGWTDYLRSRRAPGTVGYTLQGQHIQADASWTAPMRQAFSGERSVVIRQDQQAHIAAVPLRIRGEVVGVLEVERDGSKPWTDSELEMVETLVDRLGLAVENARLYEQASLAAEREHVVNRIAQDVQGAESIDEVLQSALSELSSVLGASRGIVQISPKGEEVAGVSSH